MLIDHAGNVTDRSKCPAPSSSHPAPVFYMAHGEDRGIIKIGHDSIIVENAVVRATTKYPCVIADYLPDRTWRPRGRCHPRRRGVRCDRVRDISWRPPWTPRASTRARHSASAYRSSGARHRANRLVADPARILPPDRHEEIWEVQKLLDFPEWTYGFARDTPSLMRESTHSLFEKPGAHRGDIVLDE
jgi:hypothetical protein